MTTTIQLNNKQANYVYDVMLEAQRWMDTDQQTEAVTAACGKLGRSIAEQCALSDEPSPDIACALTKDEAAVMLLVMVETDENVGPLDDTTNWRDLIKVEA